MNTLARLAPLAETSAPLAETSAPLASDSTASETNASAAPTAATPAPAAPHALRLAEAIAAKLTGKASWTAKPVNDDASTERDLAFIVRDTDGASVHVRLEENRGAVRVTFTGWGPRFDGGMVRALKKHVSITCGAARTPAALARDIERRLMPDFEPLFAEALDFVRSFDRAKTECREVAERLATATGGEVINTLKWGLPASPGAFSVRMGPCAILVRPAHGDAPVSVHLSMDDLSEATARRILAILAESSDDSTACE